MKALNIIKNPYTSLVFNIIYAIANLVIGFVFYSWWFITIGAYFTVLAVARFSVLKIQQMSNSNPDTELFAKKITGILFIVLSFCLTGINTLTAIEKRGTAFHEIVMITIAAYTFTKITIAIIGMVKTKRSASTVLKTLRNISLADACVSIYTMQRSMLASFSGMELNKILILNIFTGTAVWIVVLILGINLIGGKYTIMAKSKIAKANQKIAEVVTGGYKKIEKGVVGAYKKIEQGVVDGYTKLEDKFVDAYLTKDGETVEEAKSRLKKQDK